MAHYSDETLALLALGETHVTPDNDVHLSSCARCQSDVDQLAAVVATGRSVQERDCPAAAPAAVWERIASDIHRGQTPAAQEPTATRGVAVETWIGRGRNRRWGTSLAIAAAVGLIGGVGGTWTLTRSLTPPAQPVSVGRWRSWRSNRSTSPPRPARRCCASRLNSAP